MPQKRGAPPLYQQAEAEFMRRIARGVYPAGSLMPSEARLCAELGMSRITVRRAMEALTARRLIERRRGRGTRVAHAEELVKSVSLTGYIDDVIPLNRHRVIDDLMREPPRAVSDLLHLPPGQPVRCIRTVNHTGELPLSYSAFYFPPQTARHIAPEDFRGATPPIRVVEKRCGWTVAYAEQIIDPVIADAEIARRLGIAEGEPVLRGVRGYFAHDGTPLEVAYVHYHPTRYRYQVKLVPKVVPIADATRSRVRR